MLIATVVSLVEGARSGPWVYPSSLIIDLQSAPKGTTPKHSSLIISTSTRVRVFGDVMPAPRAALKRYAADTVAESFSLHADRGDHCDKVCNAAHATISPGCTLLRRFGRAIFANVIGNPWLLNNRVLLKAASDSSSRSRDGWAV